MFLVFKVDPNYVLSLCGSNLGDKGWDHTHIIELPGGGEGDEI